MAFFLNKILVFIDSMQFVSSSLERLVKNLSGNNFYYLTEGFGSKNLKIFKKNDPYPYEYMDGFKRFGEKKLPDRECFQSSVKDETTGDDGEKLDGHINDEYYFTCKNI